MSEPEKRNNFLSKKLDSLSDEKKRKIFETARFVDKRHLESKGGFLGFETIKGDVEKFTENVIRGGFVLGAVSGAVAGTLNESSFYGIPEMGAGLLAGVAVSAAITAGTVLFGYEAFLKFADPVMKGVNKLISDNPSVEEYEDAMWKKRIDVREVELAMVDFIDTRSPLGFHDFMENGEKVTLSPEELRENYMVVLEPGAEKIASKLVRKDSDEYKELIKKAAFVFHYDAEKDDIVAHQYEDGVQIDTIEGYVEIVSYMKENYPIDVPEHILSASEKPKEDIRRFSQKDDPDLDAPSVPSMP